MRIAARREAAGLTKGQLATYAGVSPSWVGRLEGGQIVGPSIQKLGDIARVLGCTVQDLIGPESSAATTEVEVPVEKAPAVRRLLRYSADQLNRLAEATGTLFSEPVPDEEPEHKPGDADASQGNEHPPTEHATIARGVPERDRRALHRIPLIEQAF